MGKILKKFHHVRFFHKLEYFVLFLRGRSSVLLRLKEKKLFAPGTTFYWFRNREKDFTQYFSEEDALAFCKDVQGPMKQFNIEHNVSEWRLFIDSSKTSLYVVLLHNESKYASLSVGHSVHLKECYENLKLLLIKLRYKEQGRTICGDLKVLSLLLGQQEDKTWTKPRDK